MRSNEEQSGYATLACEVPAKGTTRITDAQRRKIAAGKVAGKRNKVIARETGLATHTIDNQANEPRTKLLIIQLKAQHAVRLKGMFAKTLRGIEGDINSKDVNLRIQSRNQVLKIVTAGDPPQDRIVALGDNTAGDFTLAEMLMVYRKTTNRHGAPGHAL